MQTLERQDRVERGIATARGGQRLAGRAQLERARDEGSNDPALLMWLGWTARSPEQAADHLRALQTDPEFSHVAQAGLLWLKALMDGPEAARDRPETRPLRPTAAPQSSSASVYHVSCPRCEARLEVQGTALGQLRECPGCEQWFAVPRAGAGAVPVVNVPPEDPATELGPRVLVIDDSAAIRTAAESALKEAGYCVETAAGAHEAIERVRSWTPELVLLDIHMADANGYDVCRALRLFPALRTIPILLLTGNDGAYDAERGRAAGCNDFLTKPCTTAALVAKTHVYLPSPVLSD